MKHIQYILIMTVIVLLAACSQDDTEKQAQEPDAPLRLASVTRVITGDPEYGDIRIKKIMEECNVTNYEIIQP